VDREAGQSKMSSFIVVEALALVTWWALGRVVHALKPGGRRQRAAVEDQMPEAAEEDPVGSA
jgi:hypothetical protein